MIYSVSKIGTINKSVLVVTLFLILIFTVFLVRKQFVRIVFLQTAQREENTAQPSVIISGCARDCGKYLSKVLSKIEALSKNKNVYYVFYENDSTDDTFEQLKHFITNKNGIVISEKLNIRRRTPRIAHCRNEILKYILNNNLHRKYNFFINLDMDDVNIGLDINSVNKCLSEHHKWDIASINQSNNYYDLWALRTVAKNNNCWLEKNKSNCKSYYIHNWFPRIPELKLKKHIPKNMSYLPVLSAFGGLTIYKSNLLEYGTYSGFDKRNSNYDDCEHVKFHEDILKIAPKTRFYIIPYMTNEGSRG